MSEPLKVRVTPQLMRKHTATLQVQVLRPHWRVRLGVWLIKRGARLAGVRVDMITDTEETP